MLYLCLGIYFCIIYFGVPTTVSSNSGVPNSVPPLVGQRLAPPLAKIRPGGNLVYPYPNHWTCGIVGTVGISACASSGLDHRFLRISKQGCTIQESLLGVPVRLGHTSFLHNVQGLFMCSYVKLFMISKFQCVHCNTEGRGGEKGGSANLKTKHTEH